MDDTDKEKLAEEYKKLQRDFLKVSRRLTHFDLQKVSHSGDTFSLDDVHDQLFCHAGSTFFLGTYSREGIITVFKEYGVLRKLKNKGFTDIVVDFDLTDPFKQVLRTYYAGEVQPENMIMELIVHEGKLTAHQLSRLDTPKTQFDMIIVDWLCLQNPLGKFTPERPRLPGQVYPGLGLGKEVLGLLDMMTRRLKKHGLLSIPQYFHNAKLYHIEFHFYDPYREGEFRALERDTQGHSLSEVSWAIEKGLVRKFPDGTIFDWHGEEEVLPVTKELQDYFKTPRYQEISQEAEKNTHFKVDWNAFDSKWFQWKQAD